MKNKIGHRPTKMRPEIVEVICQNVRRGLSHEAAGRVAGISEATVNRWKKDHESFREALLKAVAQREADDLLVIQEASVNRYDREGRLTRRGSWQAAAWRLERLNHERYGQKWTGQITGKNGKPLLPESKPLDPLPELTKEQMIAFIKGMSVPIVKSTPTNGETPSNGNGSAQHG